MLDSSTLGSSYATPHSSHTMGSARWRRGYRFQQKNPLPRCPPAVDPEASTFYTPGDKAPFLPITSWVIEPGRKLDQVF